MTREEYCRKTVEEIAANQGAMIQWNDDGTWIMLNDPGSYLVDTGNPFRPKWSKSKPQQLHK